MIEDYSLYELGQRIVYLRKKRGMSQLDLSIDTGLAPSYLSELERGKRNPSVKILERVAIALEISLSELFEGVGPRGR